MSLQSSPAKKLKEEPPQTINRQLAGSQILMLRRFSERIQFISLKFAAAIRTDLGAK